MANTAIRSEDLELCRTHLKRDYGKLSDIPPELANTIANIYYRFYSVIMKSRQVANFIPPIEIYGDNPFKAMPLYIQDASLILAIVENGPEVIQSYRALGKESSHAQAVYAQALVDSWKYNIAGAMENMAIVTSFKR